MVVTFDSTKEAERHLDVPAGNIVKSISRDKQLVEGQNKTCRRGDVMSSRSRWSIYALIEGHIDGSRSFADWNINYHYTTYTGQYSDKTGGIKEKPLQVLGMLASYIPTPATDQQLLSAHEWQQQPSCYGIHESLQGQVRLC